MATTSHGFPYPVGTDLVKDGDTAIQALAQAIDPWAPVRTASGTVLITLAAANTPVSGAVTFPVGRFSVAPAVVAVPVISSAGFYSCSVTGTSTSGATIWANRTATGGATNVYWIAMESPS